MSRRPFNELGERQRRKILKTAIANARMNQLNVNRNVHQNMDVEANVEDDGILHCPQNNPGNRLFDWNNFMEELNIPENANNMVLPAEPVDRIDGIERNDLNNLEDHIHPNANHFPGGNENKGRREEAGGIEEQQVLEEEEEGEAEEEDDDLENINQPLYANSNVTVKESMLMIMSMMIRHNLNKSCVEDLIRVIESHCPRQNLIKNSLYKFNKFCGNTETNIIRQKHYFCSRCQREVAGAGIECDTCPNILPSFFVELPVINHLKELFRTQHFFEQLQERFRRSNRQDIIFDLYDGELYQDWFFRNDRFLANENNISFSIYIDKIPAFTSSHPCVWIIYLTINELPFKIRKLKENTLILGMWFGKNKPSFNLLLYKLRSVFSTLYKGINVTLSNGVEKLIRGVILMVTCDLPTQCDSLNFVHYNRTYGCPVCLEPGEIVATGPQSAQQCYLLYLDHQERTSAGTIAHANEAQPGRPRFGVKGHTVLSRLMLDFMKGLGIDRMHAVDGGVMKTILTLLFSSKYSYRTRFSLFHHVDKVNRLLKNIKPPKFVDRIPRDVTDLIHWKASELKMFLYYYSIPIFVNVMPQNIFNNYLKLVIAGSILSGDEISEERRLTAKDLLQSFVSEFEEIYGSQFCSINVHLLLHLADCVKKLGPLWCYSGYEYENLNGEFLKSVHGNRYLGTQIASVHNQYIKMNKYLEELPAGDVLNFCKRRTPQMKILEHINHHSYSVGKYETMYNVPDDVRNDFMNLRIDINYFTLQRYERLLKDDKLYLSEIYTKERQTLSSLIKYQMNGIHYGVVVYYVKLSENMCNHINCECIRHYARVRKINCNEIFYVRGKNLEADTNGYLFLGSESNEIDVIPINCILTPCFYIEVENLTYIAVPINSKEL